MPNQITSPRPQGNQPNTAQSDTPAIKNPISSDNIQWELNDILANLKSVSQGIHHALTTLSVAEKESQNPAKSIISVVTDSLSCHMGVLDWEIDRLATQIAEGKA